MSPHQDCTQDFCSVWGSMSFSSFANYTEILEDGGHVGEGGGGGVKWESEREMGADVKGVCKKREKKGGVRWKGKKEGWVKGKKREGEMWKGNLKTGGGG